MATAGLAALSDRPAQVLGVVGLVSGILSASFGFDLEPDWLRPVSNLFLLEPGMVPIGVFYGVALGLAYVLCGGAWLPRRCCW